MEFLKETNSPSQNDDSRFQVRVLIRKRMKELEILVMGIGQPLKGWTNEMAAQVLFSP